MGQEYNGFTIAIEFNEARNSYGYNITKEGKPLRGNMGFRSQEEAFSKAKEFIDTRLLTKGSVSNLDEVDQMLNEREFSLKKKIFSLGKMESLVFTDPRLTSLYDDMAINGEERYGYHYNETIMNILFNDYVLNSPKYLQKYKMAVAKKKKRRDKSEINKMKKATEKKIKARDSGEQIPTETIPVSEGLWDDRMDMQVPPDRFTTSVDKLKNRFTGKPTNAPTDEPIDETTSAGSAGGAAGYVGYAGPAAWDGSHGDLLGNKSKTLKPVQRKIAPFNILAENYLTEASFFENYITKLEEMEGIGMYNQLNKKYDESHLDSNDGLGVTAIPQQPKIQRQIDDAQINSGERYSTQDMGNMPKKDVHIVTTDATKRNTMFPSPNNPLLKDDGIVGELEEKSVSKAQQRFMGMVHGVQKGTVNPADVGHEVLSAAKTMKPKDAVDFASTQTAGLPDRIDEDDYQQVSDKSNDRNELMSNIVGYLRDKKITDKAKSSEIIDKIYTNFKNKQNMNKNVEESSMIDTPEASMALKPMGLGTDGNNGVPRGVIEEPAMSESIFTELDEELKMLAELHSNLKKIAEDRKPSSLILKDRLGNDNKANFKKDLQHSGTKEIIDVEKELEFKDQQTDIGDNPYKNGEDIEKEELKKTKGESFKNVGDSSNEKGNEIPQRNRTEEEQHEVDMYRKGLGDWDFDIEPDEKFKERMKKDMGDKLYADREEKLKIRKGMPMYNKDKQPIMSSANMSETYITGKYFDDFGKSHIADFALNECTKSEVADSQWRKLDLSGFGNKYSNKLDTETNKIGINEGISEIMTNFEFFIDNNKTVHAVKISKSLNENKSNDAVGSSPKNLDKMQHLLGYDTSEFVSVRNVKKF